MISMKIFVVVAALVSLCSSQGTILLPDISDAEVAQLLQNVPAVVDCIIDGKTVGGKCHKLTQQVRRYLPELAARNFQCGCDAQRHIPKFRAALQKDRDSFNRLAFWFRTKGFPVS